MQTTGQQPVDTQHSELADQVSEDDLRRRLAIPREDRRLAPEAGDGWSAGPVSCSLVFFFAHRVSLRLGVHGLPIDSRRRNAEPALLGGELSVLRLNTCFPRRSPMRIAQIAPLIESVPPASLWRHRAPAFRFG